MTIVTWSWLFLSLYIAGMLVIGVLAKRRVQHADDYATARRSYGPLVLALAFAASIASGSTFLGTSGLGYQFGVPTIWGKVLYPVGVYFGVLISMRLIATAGHRFGNRTIPEFLGDRYQSEGIRILVAVLSLILLFCLAGQLVSGIVMFETMLGVPPAWALLITTAVLLGYVVMGGAHADILTDGIQGVLMLCVALLIVGLTIFGAGVEGGLAGIFRRLAEQDPALVQPLNPDIALYHSWWAIISVLFAHIPLGLLPHMGNKLWALKSRDQQFSFVRLAFLFGLTMAMMGFGGLLARALFGELLYEQGLNPNQALPMLLIELLPTWLSALIGVGILSAIMSTADGLVISSSQIVANDLYRRSIVPRLRHALSDAELDRRVLRISRVATVVILLLCMALGWAMLDRNITLIVWIGTGGMMAAFGGPLVLGALWRGVTRAGAYAGLLSGIATFTLLHAQLIDPDWFGEGTFGQIASWLYAEGPNPFSCAALGQFASVLATIVVSKLTRPLSADYLRRLFG